MQNAQVSRLAVGTRNEGKLRPWVLSQSGCLVGKGMHPPLSSSARSAGRELTGPFPPARALRSRERSSGGSVGPCSLKALRLMPRLARYASRGNGRVRTEQTRPWARAGGSKKVEAKSEQRSRFRKVVKKNRFTRPGRRPAPRDDRSPVGAARSLLPRRHVPFLDL